MSPVPSPPSPSHKPDSAAPLHAQGVKAPLVIIDGIARLRIEPELDLAGVARLITHAIDTLAQTDVGRMLVDARATSVVGITMSERFDLLTQWARSGSGRVRVAMVLRQEFKDPDNIGAAHASRLGFVCRGFVEENAALNWLQGLTD